MRNRSDYRLENLTVPGLVLSTGGGSEAGHAHEGDFPGRGFNLNYGELMVSSVVDPYFNLAGVFHLSEEGFEIEEGYFTTRKLPMGTQVKAGKFLSAFSRINEQHEHSWDFSGSPLIHRAFLGEEGLNEKGVQLTCVLPSSVYWMIGAEALTGENEASFGRSGFEDPSGTFRVADKDGPNLFTVFTRTSFDVGDWIILLGASCASGGTRTDDGLEVSGIEGSALRADTRLLGGSLTLKRLIDSNRYLSFQSEFMHRRMEGRHYGKDALDAVQDASLLTRQSGAYGQLVFKYGMRSRLGVRVDRILGNDWRADGVREVFPDGLRRVSVMTEFNPTEFSRIRLQVNEDRSLFRREGMSFRPVSVRELVLQCNLSIGAHGAHPF